VTAAARWALRSYPPSFRDRYGDELAALTDDVTPSWRNTVSLFAGAARAWLLPAFTGEGSTRRRLQASVTTVWVAWCAGFLLAPAIDKALLDPPAPGADVAVRRLLDVAAISFVAGWVVVLAAALFVGRALLPAMRERRWSVLRPLLAASVLGPLEAVGLVALAVGARSDASSPAPALAALGVLWLVGLLAFLACAGFGPGIALRRLRPAESVLRVPALLAGGLSLCLAAMTASCAAAVLLAGDARLVGALAPVVVIVVVAAVASWTAVVSSARGVLALRARG
jgi:hypothetical protein